MRSRRGPDLLRLSKSSESNYLESLNGPASNLHHSFCTICIQKIHFFSWPFGNPGSCFASSSGPWSGQTGRKEPWSAKEDSTSFCVGGDVFGLAHKQLIVSKGCKSDVHATHHLAGISGGVSKDGGCAGRGKAMRDNLTCWVAGLAV